MKTYHKLNFFKHTFCEFEMCEIDFFAEMKAHFQSRSGSYYFYTEEGVYRYSDHWGRVANCRWKIKGISDYKNQNYYVGYAKWSDFYPLNTSDKSYFIKVDFATRQAKVQRAINDETSRKFLFTADMAFKRLKEIQAAFKDTRWLTYITDDVATLEKVFITKLQNSVEPLPKIKQVIRRGDWEMV